MIKTLKPWQRVGLHLALALCTFIILLGIFFYGYLPSYTLHSDSIQVPKLLGKPYKYAKRETDKLGLNLEIYDSVYEIGAKSGTIFHQFPSFTEKVKKNRRIYVTVYAYNPPMVKMPNLIDVSQKQAEMLLKSHGLQVGDIKYKYNIHKGAVLSQSIGGNKISPDTWIAKGSKVDLIVSMGLGDKTIEVMDLKGMKLTEALETVNSYGLEIGSVIYDGKSMEISGIIIKQKPEPGQTLREGEIVDLWVAGNKTKE